MAKYLLIILIILVLAGGGYYLWNSGLVDFSALMDGGETNEETTESEEADDEEEQPSVSKVEVVEVTVEAKEFSFTPSKLTVDVGTKVRLTLENGGSVSHDFVVDELDVEMTLVSPGQSQTIEFTLERAGIYEFDCSIPGHEEAGMTGTLTVK